MQGIVKRLSLLFLLSVLLGYPRLARAGEAYQAGIVIQFGGGRVETYCIAFEGAEISGADLLAASGINAIIDASKGMGITVCQIEGEGCAYPSEACFCQCMGGGDCAYWNYFYRDPGEAEWTYSALGAVLRRVSPGSVEAWVWGDGRTPPASDLTFEAICAPPVPTPTLTVELPTAIPATISPTETPSVSWSPSATAVQPTSTPTTVPVAGTGQTLSSYWPFGLMVLALASFGVLIWTRRS